MKGVVLVALVFSLVLSACCPCGSFRPQSLTAPPASSTVTEATPLPTREGAGVREATPLPQGEGMGVTSSTPLPTGEGVGVRADETSQPVGLVTIPGATVVYYDITGATASELRAQMDLLGPTDARGQRWDGNCEWRVWWEWSGTPDGGCDLAAVRLTYTITVTMPRWVPPPEATADLVSRWTAYTEALARHEQGHVERVLAGIDPIAQAIRAADCATANDAAQAVLADIQAENDAYDEETDHGATQGAIFP